MKNLCGIDNARGYFRHRFQHATPDVYCKLYLSSSIKFSHAIANVGSDEFDQILLDLTQWIV